MKKLPDRPKKPRRRRVYVSISSDAAQRAEILHALTRNKSDRIRTASWLGVSVQTLLYQIERLQIHPLEVGCEQWKN